MTTQLQSGLDHGRFDNLVSVTFFLHTPSSLEGTVKCLYGLIIMDLIGLSGDIYIKEATLPLPLLLLLVLSWPYAASYSPTSQPSFILPPSALPLRFFPSFFLSTNNPFLPLRSSAAAPRHLPTHFLPSVHLILFDMNSLPLARFAAALSSLSLSL